MKKKTLSVCVWFSGSLFIVFIGLCLYAQIADPHLPIDAPPAAYPRVAFGNSFNVSVKKDEGGNLGFFNQNEPFFGGTFRFTGDNTTSGKGWSGYGIYFFHIIHTVDKENNWWTLMISLWYPIIFFAILPAIFVIRKIRNRLTKATTIEKRDE